MPQKPAKARAFANHNHKRCHDEVMAEALGRCAERGVRLTPVRRRVLQILLESHKPIGAYELLKRLTAEGFPGQPPIVYRALEFLQFLGVVHRIESKNAFVACGLPKGVHPSQFLICTECARIAEFESPDVTELLVQTAAVAGFEIAKTTLEIEGVCQDCRTSDR